MSDLELMSDLERRQLLARLAELLDDGEDWFIHESDVVEWTSPKYHHQN